MSKRKRRAQANARGAFALGFEPEEWAQYVVWRMRPHQIIRWRRRKENSGADAR